MKTLTSNYLDRTFLDMGFKLSLDGYKFMKESMQVISEDPNIKTLALYNIIANRCNSTPQRVERNIRHLVRTYYKEMGEEYFIPDCLWPTNEKKDHLSNREFLQRLHTYLLLEDDE